VPFAPVSRDICLLSAALSEDQAAVFHEDVAVARALRPDEAERAHVFDLARARTSARCLT